MPGTEELLIVGAGGFARETAQAVRDVSAADMARGRAPRWRVAGHLDDDPALHGREVDGVPVLGGCERVHELSDARVVVCVGSPRDYAVRARLVRRLGLPVHRYATVVHPTAVVSESSTLGVGSVLLAHCVLTAAVRVGAHVAVMPQVVLTHDDTVGDFATLASGVRLGGGVRLGRGAYVGAGSLVREYTQVGAWSLTGMGSTVLADVPPGEVWAGSPARRLRGAGGPALDELARESREARDATASGDSDQTNRPGRPEARTPEAGVAEARPPEPGTTEARTPGPGTTEARTPGPGASASRTPGPGASASRTPDTRPESRMGSPVI